MKIRSITVHTGRTLSVPKCLYQNLRPGITLTADLEEGEEPLEAARDLHIKAETLMEDQCDELVAFVTARTLQRNKKLRQQEPVGA